MAKTETIRHSLSHIMASAIKELYPKTKFAIGPAIENGFYYDFDFKKPVSSEDLPKIEKKMKEIIKKDISFDKEEVSKEEAKKIFKDQPYKLELIKEMDGKISTYESGNFLDLCKGPHVKSSKEIPVNGFKLSKIAGAYWRGNEKKSTIKPFWGTVSPPNGKNKYLKRLSKTIIKELVRNPARPLTSSPNIQTLFRRDQKTFKPSERSR